MTFEQAKLVDPENTLENYVYHYPVLSFVKFQDEDFIKTKGALYTQKAKHGDPLFVQLKAMQNKYVCLYLYHWLLKNSWKITFFLIC